MKVKCLLPFEPYIYKNEVYEVTKVWQDGDILPTGLTSLLAYSLLGVPDQVHERDRSYAWVAARFTIVHGPYGRLV